MHLVVHTYDYIHLVHLSMTLVITTLQEEEINLQGQMSLLFCLLQGLIFKLLDFENIVEGLPSLI